MPTKKYKQKLMKCRICQVARMICCASFLVLAIIGVSSLAKAMSLETIANENGVPTVWQAASLGNPETITVPVTYWDQRQDACEVANRQFEWTECGYWTKGALQGVVKDHLGSDGLPIPAYTNSTDAWLAHLDVFTANITGHDPVQPGDNFYRWFHEVDGLSKQFDREVTFNRIAHRTYTFGRDGTFPLDDVNFSDGDNATKSGHNFHFTSRLSIPIKVAADGTERFDFSGDDDVWVFLNGKLVLDIGGLHEKLNGHFVINQDGTLSTFVEHVNDTSGRDQLGTPSPDFNGYVDPLNNYNMATYKNTEKRIDIGLKADDVVNLDVFYAERSTTESNVHITLTNMNWPISANSVVDGKIVGTIETTQNNLVEYISSITNRDPLNKLTLQRLASYISDQATSTDENGQTQTNTINGFLPLDSTTLWYSRTPDDATSWQPVEISAPQNSDAGFVLATPLEMGPNGSDTDTLYFRFFAETAGDTGIISNVTSYYTELDGAAGVTYDNTHVSYTTSKPPIEQKYHVSIKYLYEDGTPAADAYYEEYNSGDTFEITSPEIENYTPDITKVFGTVSDSDLEYIVYYKPTEQKPDPTPDTYKVTIHYIYENGTKAADDYIAELQPGQEFNVPSPDIDRHTPDYDVITGLITDTDLEYIVRYKPVVDPTPVDPTPPTDPTPSNPIPSDPTPVLPPANDFDDNLVYIGPLGQVAYVPNTGVISDIVAPIFEQYFADVILSQGFILGMLALFASSFAVYFSLRRFLVLAPMASKSSASTVTTKKGRAMNAKKATAKSSLASAKKSRK